MNFEEGSVLESTDGVSYKKETEIVRSDDAARAKAKAVERGSGLSLAAQLAEAKGRKDDEWKEKNNPFRAPKGLDDEDVAFLSEHDATRRAAERQLKAQDELDLQLFKGV